MSKFLSWVRFCGELELTVGRILLSVDFCSLFRTQSHRNTRSVTSGCGLCRSFCLEYIGNLLIVVYLGYLGEIERVPSLSYSPIFFSCLRTQRLQYGSRSLNDLRSTDTELMISRQHFVWRKACTGVGKLIDLTALILSQCRKDK